MKVKSTTRMIPGTGEIHKSRWHSKSPKGPFTLVGTDITASKEDLIKDARGRDRI